MSNDILDRIELCLQWSGMTAAKASEATGKGEDLIRNLRRKPSIQPTISTIKSLSEVFNVRFEWLAIGEGAPTEELSEIVDHAISNGVTVTAQEHQLIENFTRNFVLLPEIDVTIGLGAGGEVVPAYEHDTIEGMRPSDAVKARLPMRRAALVEMGLDPEMTDVVQFRGDSMSPIIEDGDWGFIDRRARVPSPPDIYVLWDGWSCVAKHLELVKKNGEHVVRIISANKAYREQEEPLDAINVIGRVARIITRPRANSVKV